MFIYFRVLLLYRDIHPTFIRLLLLLLLLFVVFCISLLIFSFDCFELRLQLLFLINQSNRK